jgi:hypothetical protein
MACSGVSSFPARFDVTQGRPPHRSRPRPARAIPQRSPPAPPAAQAPGQACNLPGLWTSLCLLRNRSRSRERHSGSRNPALPRRVTPAGQPRLGLPSLQPAERLAATHRILRPVSGGRAELHAVCESGAPAVEERGTAGGESVLRAGGLARTTAVVSYEVGVGSELHPRVRFFQLPTLYFQLQLAVTSPRVSPLSAASPSSARPPTRTHPTRHSPESRGGKG